MSWLPNILTLSRVFLTIGFVFFLTRTGLEAVIAATVLFIAASLTDFLDGYLAKKRNGITDFGKIMDPIADKFLILTAFFIFVQMHIVAAWMFYVILVRELTVTASRIAAVRKGRFLAAEAAGKWKTVLQIAAISVILLFLMVQELSRPATGNSGGQPEWLPVWNAGIQILMLLTVALTLISGLSYFWNNRKTLSV